MLTQKSKAKYVSILLWMLLAVGFYIFYSRIVPIVPFDTDDWYYMGYYRIPLPLWGDWNPSRVLPEIIMPNISIVAARVLYPLTGQYIGSMTMIYAAVIAFFIVMLCVQLFRLFEAESSSKLAAILFTCLWILVHFTLLAGATANNTFLWGSLTATCYFYYIVPALWNEALVIYLIRKKGKIASALGKICVCILCYFGIFSNLFPAVILPAYAGMAFLLAFVDWFKNQKAAGHSRFLVFLREQLLNLYIIILFIISAIFEMSGGRASDFSGFQFGLVMQTLRASIIKLNVWAVLSIAVLVAYTICVHLKQNEANKVQTEERHRLISHFGSFVTVLVFMILLCARTGAWYIGRQDVLVDIYFFLFLAVFTAASHACAIASKKKVNCCILGIALLLNVVIFGKAQSNFYTPTNSGYLPVETCLQIDDDIVQQITTAVENGEKHMELHVPKFDTADNWPFATYAGGKYSRFAYTLYRHGLIRKGIAIDVIPDEEKNAEFRIG